MIHSPDRHVSHTDAARLSRLIAMRARTHPYERDDLEDLADALAGAQVLPAEAVARDRIALGSQVALRVQRDDDWSAETLVLVEPQHALPGQGRVSVLSPLGRALIGVRAGERVRLALPGGREADVEVLAIEDSDAAPQAGLAVAS